MSVCIPTYMLASGLIAGGMSWRQAIGTILLGNLIVLIPMLLNAHAGAKYGIPFPVFVRASFGVRGANIPAVLRALVACGWFGIQTWIGGQAIYSMLKILWPAAAQFPAGIWVCFFAFWALNMFVIWRGIDTIKFLEGIGAPFMLGTRPAAAVVDYRARPAASAPCSARPVSFTATGNFCASLFHRSPAWSVSGPRSRSIFPISRATPNRKSAQAAGPGARIARRHDALFLHRRGCYIGLGGPVRRAHLGPGGAPRPLQSTRRGFHRADRAARRHAQYQRRRQCGLALQRFFESEPAPDLVPHRRH